jgi:hypothetical protein
LARQLNPFRESACALVQGGIVFVFAEEFGELCARGYVLMEVGKGNACSVVRRGERRIQLQYGFEFVATFVEATILLLADSLALQNDTQLKMQGGSVHIGLCQRQPSSKRSLGVFIVRPFERQGIGAAQARCARATVLLVGRQKGIDCGPDLAMLLPVDGCRIGLARLRCYRLTTLRLRGLSNSCG